MRTQKTIHVIEYARGIDPESQARQRALKHGGEQRSAQSLAGNIRDKKRRPPIAQRKHVEVIASDRQTRKIEAGDGEVREFAEIVRKQSLLNTACDIDFLFEELPFAFALDEPCVVQNTGSVGGQRV